MQGWDQVAAHWGRARPGHPVWDSAAAGGLGVARVQSVCVSTVKGVSSTGGLSGSFDFSSCVCVKIETGVKNWTLNCGAALQRWKKGIWKEHKRRGRVGGYKLRNARTVRGGRACDGSSRTQNPLQVFWSQLAFFLIYSCFFISLCSPFSCLVITVLSSPQGAGCSVLLGEAYVCVNQPSHSLQKWPNLSFSLCVTQISISLCILLLKIYTACFQGSIVNQYRCTIQPKVVTTQFFHFIFFLKKLCY